MHREKQIHIHLRVGFVGAKIEKLATCVQLLNGNSKHHIKKLNTYSTSLARLREEEYESYNSDKPIIYEDLVHDLIMECLYFIA